MRSIDRTSRVWLTRLAAAIAIAILGLLAGRVESAEPDHITIYAPQQSFQLAVTKQQDREYVDLVVALAQFGTVASERNGPRFKLRFASISAQFEDSSRSAKIGRNSVILPDAFRLSENSAQVTVQSLVELLPHFLNQRADYHDLSHRVFIGNGGTRFAVELQRTPAALLLIFSEAVSPQISVEGGKMRLVFNHDGVIPPAESWRFNDSLITSAAFEEKPSGPELTVTATEPLLATFAAGGRTISIAAAPKAAAVQSAPATALVAAPSAPAQPAAPVVQAPAATPPGESPLAPNASAENPLAPRPHVAVLIDAGHGGDEPGAALSSDLAEKDVTLALARRLRAELQNRGVSCALIRDSDATLTQEQRAVVANTTHPGLYLALHAGALGSGVRIYNAMLPAAKLAPAAFQPWETAQAGYVN
ncbi:MAG TPA: N-acetylmuramoyl-L-alanine amidase, partial [Terriglobales bacterium]|nr:N-acetylmuramoyl-L-alanine amidase [Terriglobales bacterium]